MLIMLGIEVYITSPIVSVIHGRMISRRGAEAQRLKRMTDNDRGTNDILCVFASSAGKNIKIEMRKLFNHRSLSCLSCYPVKSFPVTKMGNI